MAPEDLPDRRAMAAGEELQLHRAPVRLDAGLEDRLLLRGRQRPWTTAGQRAPGRQARPACPLRVGCGLPAMPPPVRGRRCDVEGSRGGPQARTLLNHLNQFEASSQSELAPTVFHVRSPLRGSVVADRTFRWRPDTSINRSLGL